MAVIRLDVFVIAPALLLTTLFTVSVVQLALIAHVVGWTNSESTFLDTPDVDQTARTGKVPLPPNLNYESSACLLACSACSILASGLLGALIYTTERGLKLELNFGKPTAHSAAVRKRLHESSVMFSLSGVLVVLTTGVLIFCFIDPGRSHSPSISYNPSSNTVTNYDQYQTLETWTCVLSVKASSLNILRQQCRQARAARFLLIPNIAVTALLACCLAWRQRVFNLHQDDVPDKVEIDALEKRTGFVTRPSEQTIVELDTGSAKEVAGGQITELPQAAAELPGPKMTYNGAEYFAGTAIPSATVHSGWPLDRVILWLSVNNFSIEWQELFRYLNLDEGLFLDLGRDDANKKDANAMYHKILPQLAQQYRKSGVRWDRQKARDESRRLQRLIRSILED